MKGPYIRKAILLYNGVLGLLIKQYIISYLSVNYVLEGNCFPLSNLFQLQCELVCACLFKHYGNFFLFCSLFVPDYT